MGQKWDIMIFKGPKWTQNGHLKPLTFSYFPVHKNSGNPDFY